jgi:hypothetical protein
VLIAKVENVLDVEISTWYPAGLFFESDQSSLGRTLVPFAPFAGDPGLGVEGGLALLKLPVVQALCTPFTLARTRQ